MRIILQLIFVIVFVTVNKGDYILYEVTAFNPHERAFLYYLQLKVPSMIFLNGVSNEVAISMDVIAKQDIAQMFEGSLQSLNIQYTRVSQTTLEKIYKKQNIANISDTFYDWNDLLKWISTKENQKLKKIVIGKTYEKRDIYILRIISDKKNPTVCIVGGEDGMDWISSAVIFNLVDELVESDTELKMLSNNFNFYFLPILNPDGFVYSKNQDRFWSKNRRVLYTHTQCENGIVPVGVNIARNWFLQKSSKMSDEECNSIYNGHRALSEEENQSLAYVLNNLALDMIAFINVRGFGEYITVPYADSSEETNNHNIIMEILKSTCSKVRKKHNLTFYLGTSSRYLCNMADWVKKKLNTPLVYTVYLEDTATVLPLPQNIKSISQQFVTILNESLHLTKEIYGPLFNNQTRSPISYFIIQLCCIVLCENIYFHVI